MLITKILLLFFTANAGSEVGNGGGGVIVNGEEMIFPRSGYQVTTHLLQEVPGYQELEAVINTLNLDAFDRAELLAVIRPSSKRKYFKVPSLPAEDDIEIRQVYSDLYNVPLSDIIVFAHTKNRDTYLLDTYFRQDSVAQASILFHEAIWVLKPKASYVEVMALETAFYNYAIKQTGDNESKLLELLSLVLGSPSYTFQKNVNDFLKNGQIPLSKIFNESYIKCAEVGVNLYGCKNLYEFSIKDAVYGFTRNIYNFLEHGADIEINTHYSIRWWMRADYLYIKDMYQRSRTRYIFDIVDESGVKSGTLTINTQRLSPRL